MLKWKCLAVLVEEIGMVKLRAPDPPPPPSIPLPPRLPIKLFYVPPHDLAPPHPPLSSNGPKLSCANAHNFNTTLSKKVYFFICGRNIVGRHL